MNLSRPSGELKPQKNLKIVEKRYATREATNKSNHPAPFVIEHVDAFITARHGWCSDSPADYVNGLHGNCFLIRTTATYHRDLAYLTMSTALLFQIGLPPHVCDLYAFLIHYLSVTPTPSYSTLRSAFLHAEICRLPISLPRFYPIEQWVQALYQSTLLLLRKPCILNKFTQTVIPECRVRHAALVLLVLLEGSIAKVAVLLDEESALAIGQLANEGDEMRSLVRYLEAGGKVRRVEVALRGGIVAPEVLGGRRKGWGWHGYEVAENVAASIAEGVRTEIEDIQKEVGKEGKSCSEDA